MKSTFHSIAFGLLALSLASPAYAGGVTLGKDPAADRRAGDDRHFGMHSAADANRNSAITIEEWAAYKSSSGKRLPEFASIDTDRNGFISPQEMIEAKNQFSALSDDD